MYDYDKLVELNTFCHNNKIGFIYAGSMGLYTYCFVDYGEKFTIRDPDGEECSTALITHIGNENPALITCPEDKRHGL